MLAGGAAVVAGRGPGDRGLPPVVPAGAALPAVLALRLAARARRRPRRPLGWTRLLIGCVQLHLLTGIALAAGLVLSAIRW